MVTQVYKDGGAAWNQSTLSLPFRKAVDKEPSLAGDTITDYEDQDDDDEAFISISIDFGTT